MAWTWDEGNDEYVWSDDPWTPDPDTEPGGSSEAPPGTWATPDLNDFWKTLTPQKLMDLIGPVGKAIGGAGIASLLNSAMSGGPKVPRAYPGGIPNLVANREQLAQPAQGRRPGSGGVTYFSPMTYSAAPTPAADPTGTIKNYIQSLAWGNPEADAIATPKLMAEMARRGWSMDQLAKGSGFSAEALQAMFDKYGTATPPASVQDMRSAAAAAAPAPANAVFGGSPTQTAAAPATSRSGAVFGGTPTQTTAAASTPYAIDANPSVWDLVSQVSQQANYQRDPNVAANAANPYRQANEINLDTMQYYFPELNQGKNAQAEYSAAMAASQGGGPGAVFGGSPTRFAQGGIASLGYAKGRLLDGPGDGVSDSIPATINGTHPAALADGEYIVPARLVSELGNGSTKAGAQRLDEMMRRIQRARKKSIGKNNVAVDSKAYKNLPA